MRQRKGEGLRIVVGSSDHFMVTNTILPSLMLILQHSLVTGLILARQKIKPFHNKAQKREMGTSQYSLVGGVCVCGFAAQSVLYALDSGQVVLSTAASVLACIC